MQAQWQNSREVSERIFIQGKLVLETPANFGNGDTEGLTDIPILFDASDGKTPLLTGTSIAGALRNYLRQLEAGYGAREERDGALMAERLFGYLNESKKDDRTDSILSWLMVDDALGELPEDKNAIELRDGVAIDPKTRTAKLDKNKKGQKFDLELLAAGTTFRLHFEFWLNKNNQSSLEALALALKGFEDGAIGLGLRKGRGYGQCKVTGWQIQRYRMDDKNGILNWLTHQEPESDNFQPDIMRLLNVSSNYIHQGERFILDAKFKLDSSVLIRSGTGNPAGPDFVHLRSLRGRRDDEAQLEMKPVLSGTSLAGVIRQRAQRIALTMVKIEQAAKALVDGMFGSSMTIKYVIHDKLLNRLREDEELKEIYKRLLPEKNRVFIEKDEFWNFITGKIGGKQAEKHKALIMKLSEAKDGPRGSRIVISETEIENGIDDLIQTRIKIDRFTGGAFLNALFSEQPLFGRSKTKTRVHLHLELRKTPAAKHFDAEIGLLLLMLKDLWTGDLPVGGESSVGRGRLSGIQAKLSLGKEQWEIRQTESGLEFKGRREDLQKRFVNAFLEM
jgi:CRISPR/Cas system CSM-associated protein Csm3 (group 7 of RAMP superfamily)